MKWNPDNCAANAFAVTVGNVDMELIGQNPRRIGLIISSDPTNRITLSFGGPAVLDAGINLYAGGMPQQFTYHDYGAGIQGPIRVIGAAAAQTIGVVEIISLA